MVMGLELVSSIFSPSVSAVGFKPLNLRFMSRVLCHYAAGAMGQQTLSQQRNNFKSDKTFFRRHWLSN
jgi:hypothetical protein